MLSTSTTSGTDSECRAEFKEVDILGQGNFSKVTKVKHRMDGMEYAIKRSLREITQDSLKRQWFQVRDISHPISILKKYNLAIHLSTS